MIILVIIVITVANDATKRRHNSRNIQITTPPRYTASTTYNYQSNDNEVAPIKSKNSVQGKFCVQCGSGNVETAEYCNTCGSKIPSIDDY